MGGTSCTVLTPASLLFQIKKLRSKAYKNVHKREKTVSRAYGGSLCGGAVRSRILRAFLVEEQKIVKKMTQAN